MTTKKTISGPQWTEFLSCPLCFNVFDETLHRPVSLGCGHTVCKACLLRLEQKICPFDQSPITRSIDDLPVNYALLQLVGAAIPDQDGVNLAGLSENFQFYDSAKKFLQELMGFIKPDFTGLTLGSSTTSSGLYKPASLSRPMQRKLVALVTCQLVEEEGRSRAMRAARSLGERCITELILLHQNPLQLSTNLWAAVRARGCQFLGPAMQEEVLKLILLALEDGSALSRKVLVRFVVQRLEAQYPQASKTAIGHVVQLLYRASCFKVTKRDEESSLMQLKDEFRSYDSLRREHDAQIVQIATEAGLRIAPEQWSALLYGDTVHKSHMQSIIDKLQTYQSFGQSITELMMALQRTGDPGNLAALNNYLEFLAGIDPSSDVSTPSWENLELALKAVKTVVQGLVTFAQAHAPRYANDLLPGMVQVVRYKTSMCRDLMQKGTCPRGAWCTFAHSQDELERYRAKAKKQGKLTMPMDGKVSEGMMADLTVMLPDDDIVKQAMTDCSFEHEAPSPEIEATCLKPKLILEETTNLQRELTALSMQESPLTISLAPVISSALLQNSVAQTLEVDGNRHQPSAAATAEITGGAAPQLNAQIQVQLGIPLVNSSLLPAFVQADHQTKMGVVNSGVSLSKQITHDYQIATTMPDNYIESQASVQQRYNNDRSLPPGHISSHKQSVSPSLDSPLSHMRYPSNRAGIGRAGVGNSGTITASATYHTAPLDPMTVRGHSTQQVPLMSTGERRRDNNLCYCIHDSSRSYAMPTCGMCNNPAPQQQQQQQQQQQRGHHHVRHDVSLAQTLENQPRAPSLDDLQRRRQELWVHLNQQQNTAVTNQKLTNQGIRNSHLYEQNRHGSNNVSSYTLQSDNACLHDGSDYLYTRHHELGQRLNGMTLTDVPSSVRDETTGHYLSSQLVRDQSMSTAGARYCDDMLNRTQPSLQHPQMTTRENLYKLRPGYEHQHHIDMAYEDLYSNQHPRNSSYSESTQRLLSPGIRPLSVRSGGHGDSLSDQQHHAYGRSVDGYILNNQSQNYGRVHRGYGGEMYSSNIEQRYPLDPHMDRAWFDDIRHLNQQRRFLDSTLNHGGVYGFVPSRQTGYCNDMGDCVRVDKTQLLERLVDDSVSVSRSTASIPLTYVEGSALSSGAVTANDSYVPWSLGETETVAKQESAEPVEPEYLDNDEKDENLALFGTLPFDREDLGNCLLSEEANQSTEPDEFIPFDRPIVSKYGPISRSAKSKMKISDPVQVMSEHHSKIFMPVTAVTPISRPYPVAMQAPSKFITPSGYTGVSMNPVLTTTFSSGSTHMPIFATRHGEMVGTLNNELYTLWDRYACRVGSPPPLMYDHMHNHNLASLRTQQRLALELHAVEREISLKTGKTANAHAAMNQRRNVCTRENVVPCRFPPTAAGDSSNYVMSNMSSEQLAHREEQKAGKTAPANTSVNQRHNQCTPRYAADNATSPSAINTHSWKNRNC